jgi:hypothetical protein
MKIFFRRVVINQRQNAVFSESPILEKAGEDLVVRGLAIFELPVNQYAMRCEPYIKLIGKELNKRLDRFEGIVNHTNDLEDKNYHLKAVQMSTK